MYLQFIIHSFKLSVIISRSFIWCLFTSFLKLVHCFWFSGARTLWSSLLYPEVSRVWWIKHSFKCNRNWICWPWMTDYAFLIMCVSCWVLISPLNIYYLFKIDKEFIHMDDCFGSSWNSAVIHQHTGVMPFFCC